MVVSVRGVNLQPVFGGVRTAFRMCALALPIFLAHQIKQLRSRGACAAERFQGGSRVAVVVVQSRGKRFLVVALNQWMIFDQQASQPQGAGGFTVGEVMNYFG